MLAVKSKVNLPTEVEVIFYTVSTVLKWWGYFSTDSFLTAQLQ